MNNGKITASIKRNGCDTVHSLSCSSRLYLFYVIITIFFNNHLSYGEVVHSMSNNRKLSSHYLSASSNRHYNRQSESTHMNALHTARTTAAMPFIQPDTTAKLQKCNHLQTNHQNNHYSNNCYRSITQSVRDIANNIIHDSTKTVSQVLRGDVAGHVPTEIYGQTTQEEVMECQSLYYQDYNNSDIENHHDENSFLPNDALFSIMEKIRGDKDSFHFNPSYDNKNYCSKNIHDKQLQDEKRVYFFDDDIHERKLYGGAQYHRLLQCYHQIFLTTPISTITDEEISLLVHGVSDDRHDGSDLLRSVAILSSKKIDELAKNVLKSLARQMEFVLGSRMWNVVEYTLYTRELSLRISKVCENDEELNLETVEALERDLILFVKQCFGNFVKEKVHLAFCQASGDIDAMMRFVNWDLAFSNGSIGGSLVSQSSVSLIQSHNNMSSEEDDTLDTLLYNEEENEHASKVKVITPPLIASINSQTNELLLHIKESVQKTLELTPASGHSLKRTYAAVNTLVHYVTTQWRREISRLVTTKFNGFCLVALHDEFGLYLRKEMNRYLDEYLKEMY